MKKSTLITTIAMIVVVVVALSTATYAWFAGATNNQTEQTMTTQPATGWYLYGGSVNSQDASASNFQQAGVNVTYSQTAPIALNLLNSGLYAPAAQLANNLTNANGNDLAATYTDTQFFAAKQQGFGIVDTAEVIKPVSFDHIIGSAQETAKNLNAIRIVNGNATTETCHLTILVYTTASPTTQELLAGKGFTMYIATSKAAYFTTGYQYASGFTSGESSGVGAALETANRAGSEIGKSAGVNFYSNSGAGAEAVATRAYVTAAGTEKFGTKELTAGSQYYTIDIELGQLTAGEALNIVFYAWFDGWALDTTAEGGTIGINLSFGGERKVVA